MKLLLQADWEADNMTAPVKQAIIELAWKGVEVKRIYMTLDNLKSYDKILKYADYTPIGTVEFVKAFAEKIGVKLPDPIHATELLKLEGRWFFKDIYRKACSPTDLYPDPLFPVFVKPYNELKKFTGFVAKSDKDFDLYPEVDWYDTKLFCTQVLENIVSEWRCYVLNGKVFACVNYAGDPLVFPSKHSIKLLIDDYKNSPVAYSLDVAVCAKDEWMAILQKTSFIEINDAYALGYYGGNVELYTKMLNERWKQIIKNQ